MSKEVELISQLAAVRKALEDERAGLLARVAVIDETWGGKPSKVVVRPKKGTNIKET